MWSVRSSADIQYSVRVLFLIGGLTALPGALLPLWFMQMGIDSRMTGNCFLALSLGLLCGMGISAGLPGLLGLTVRAYFAASGIMALLSLAALSAVYVDYWPLAAIFGLGFSAGMLGAGVSRLLSPALTPSFAAVTASLAGISLGAGAITACLLVWALSQFVAVHSLVLVIAVLPFVLLLGFRRVSIFQYPFSPAPSVRAASKEIASPVTALLGASLLFQAAGQWVIAGWLPLYLTRKHGAALGAGLLALLLYWLGLTCGRVAGLRLTAIEEQPGSALVSVGAVVLSSAFLLRTADPVIVATAALLLGAGMGLMHPITVTMIGRRFGSHPRFFSGVFFLVFVAGMLAPWLVGLLAEALGIDIVVCTTLGLAVAVFLLQNVVYAEMKFGSRAVAVK